MGVVVVQLHKHSIRLVLRQLRTREVSRLLAPEDCGLGGVDKRRGRLLSRLSALRPLAAKRELTFACSSVWTSPLYSDCSRPPAP